jgi:hypothetical protein
MGSSQARPCRWSVAMPSRCPLWSRTTKHASNSSTDHGGGKRRAVNLALWLRDAFPSAVRSYQALTFYPALAYGVDNNRIGSANFIGIGNRGLSGRLNPKQTCTRLGFLGLFGPGGMGVGGWGAAEPRLMPRNMRGPATQIRQDSVGPRSLTCPRTKRPAAEGPSR